MIERGVDTVIRCPVYDAGALVAPDASDTYDVLDHAGNSVQSGTISISSSIAEITVLGSKTTGESLSDHWLVKWELTISSADRVFVNNAHLCRYLQAPSLVSLELYRRYPQLDPSASDALFSSLSHLEDFIDEAWEEITRRLINRGRRPELILQPSALNDPHRELALALAFGAASTQLNPAYSELAQQHRRLYDAAWAEVTFEYDADEDGIPDDGKVGAEPPLWVGV